MNEEVDSTAIINEIIGPDEEEIEAAFEINRRKLNEARQKRNEGRAQKQLEAVNKVLPKFTIQDISEGLSDMKAGQTGAMLGGSILGEYLPLPKGVGQVIGAGGALAAKKLVIDPIVDEVFKTTRSIFNMAQEIPSGRMFGVTAGAGNIKGAKKVARMTPTTFRDLGLYGAYESMFKPYATVEDALLGGAKRGGSHVKVGQNYYTVFNRSGKTQILPYNKWYQKNVNPFKPPKNLMDKLRKFEDKQQLDIFKPQGLPQIQIPYGTKGKFRKVPAITKYPKGTVNEFENWYKETFKLQKEEQALNRQLSVMLEKLGNITARNPGKKIFDTDMSHIAPRSKGGSGLTFQEA